MHPVQKNCQVKRLNGLCKAGCPSGFNARYIEAFHGLVAPDNRPGM